MDRQRIDGGVKKTTGNIRSGEAMDAVREVVNQEGEGNAEKSRGRIRSDAMDAVREVVKEEKK